jgi:glycosyltransferase involved in cell wall biosynthesis
MSTPGRPMVSVLVVVSERPVLLDRLYQAHASALRGDGRTFEFIFALASSSAGCAEPLRELRAAGEPVRVLEVAQNQGEATLLRLAASKARGDILLSIPAYWRVEPESIPTLLRAVEAGADMVVARRWPRADSWVNRLQNRVFHRLLRSLTGSRLHDLACGVRAFRPAVLDGVHLYGDLNRFFPLLAQRAGFRVEEAPLPHHPHDVSPRVYSPGIYVRRVLDLLGVFFLLRFTHKPLRFFGIVGTTLSAAGAVILLVLAVQRVSGQGIADRPLLLLGVLLLALGVQAVALGLIGEIIVFLSAHDTPSYRIVRDSEPAPAAGTRRESEPPELEGAPR